MWPGSPRALEASTTPPPPYSSTPGYSFKLESANLERMYLHTSKSTHYSEVNDPDNTDLPLCLRTGAPCEVNLSATFSTYSILK